MADKKTTKAAAPKAATTEAKATEAVKTAAAAITAAVKEEDAPDVTLATAAEEDAMRAEATSDKARKEAIAAGKKDPYLKWGAPDADQEAIAARRGVFGGI